MKKLGLFIGLFIFVILFSQLTAMQAPDTLWTRTYGGSKEDLATCVRQTSGSGYIIVGWTKSFGNLGGDIYLIKL
ncbi:MAG: hypothetical protein PHX21_10615 [bacterium]|nr:hypothetical protein [bacterium]